MQKKRVNLVVLLGVFFLISVTGVYAADYCITPTSCEISPGTCSGGATLQTSDSDLCAQTCCCVSTGTSGMKSTGICTLEGGTSQVGITSTAACQSACSTVVTCPSTTCGLPAASDCFCGDTEISAGEYCCSYTPGSGYSTQTSCQQANVLCAPLSQSTVDLEITVTRNGDIVSGATVTVNSVGGGTTDNTGKIVVSSVAISGSVSASATSSGVTYSGTASYDGTGTPVGQKKQVTVQISQCIDSDNDGVCVSSDCDDNNANVAPGKAEICNNAIDDNCNGVIDTDCSTSAALCGNGVKNTNEVCDTAGVDITSNPCISSGKVCDACIACIDYVAPRCGDGLINLAGEQCDLGGENGKGKGCDNLCKLTYTCGNGIIETGSPEECDINQANGQSDTSTACPSACDIINCKCIAKWTCGNSIIEPTEQCDLGAQNGQSGKLCTIDCKEIKQCVDPKAPENYQLSRTDDDISLSWQTNSVSCTIDHYDISICIGDDCEAIENFDQYPTLTQSSYSFPDITEDRTITVMIEAVYQGGFTNSSFYSFSTGDEECFTRSTDSTFCSTVNTVLKCDAQNSATLQDDCNEKSYTPLGGTAIDYVCTQKSQDTASCMPQVFCSQCNGFLGSYSDQSYDPKAQILDIAQGRERLTSCWVSNDVTPMCYYDISRTTIDRFYSCDASLSCYNLLSEDACDRADGSNQNACMPNDGPCEWLDNPNQDSLSAGLCRPQNEVNYDCSKCDELASSSKANQVFGGCNKDTCAMFGQCYFDGYSCNSKQETTCEDFSNFEIDCHNSNSPYADSTSGPRDVNLNDATNNFISRSDDYFSFSKCRWEEYQEGGETLTLCYKDGDDNNLPDCTSGYQDTDDSCRHDFDSPTTQIDDTAFLKISGKILVPKLFNMPYSATDINGLFDTSLGVKETLFCISKTPCYPNIVAGADGIMFTEIATATEEDFNLYYYSIDEANNKEVVKGPIQLLVDPVPPNLELKNITREILIPGNDSLTTLSLNFTNKDAFNITCTARLEDEFGAAIEREFYPDNEYHEFMTDRLISPNAQVEMIYANLLDGKYYLNYSCADRAKNRIAQRLLFSLDANTAITNSKPYGPIRQGYPSDANDMIDSAGDVIISVQTASAADCKYKLEPSNDAFPEKSSLNTYYTSMADSFSDFSGDRKMHSATLTGINPNVFYNINVLCKLDDFNGIQNNVQGNKADRIRFIIDDKAPQIRFVDKDGQIINESIPMGVQKTLKLMCDDRTLNDEKTSLFEDKFVYGCANITYGVALQSDLTSTIYSGEIRNIKEQSALTNPITFNKHGVYVVSYQAVDKSGNGLGIPMQKTITFDLLAPNFNIKIFEKAGSEVGFDTSLKKFSLTSGEYYLNLSPSEELGGFTLKSIKIDGSDQGSLDITPSQPIAVIKGENIIIAFTIPGKDHPAMQKKQLYSGSIKYTASDIYAHSTGDKSISFEINFIPPPAPFLMPLFDGVLYGDEDYYSCLDKDCEAHESYPVYFADGTYYTNQQSLYVTGFNTKPATTLFRVGKKAGTFDSTITIAKGSAPTVIGLPVAKYETDAFSSKINLTSLSSASEIVIGQDYSNNYVSLFGKYLGSIDGRLSFRTDYGYFGEYYKINSGIKSSSGQLNHPFYEVDLNVPIEISLAQYQNLTIYDLAYAENFFGDNLTLTLGENYFYAAAQKGVISPTDEFKIIYDNVAPTYVTFSENPQQGSWGEITHPINISFFESDTGGSGINPNLLVFEINGVKFTINSARVKLNVTNSSGGRTYTASISPTSSKWDDGDYDINVTVSDYARNSINHAWSFEIDACNIKQPNATFISSTSSETSIPYKKFNYMRNSPSKIILDFEAGGERFTQVDLKNISLFGTDLAGISFSCNQKTGPQGQRNYFECTITGDIKSQPLTGVSRFSNEHFRFNITGSKRLTDGYVCDPTQTYIDLIIDNTPPGNVMIKSDSHYARHNATYDGFNFRVDNEFDIKAEIKYDPSGTPATIHQMSSSDYDGDNNYTLSWNIPHYAQNTMAYKPFSIKICDIVGNCVEDSNTDGTIFIDQKAPEISELSIDIPESSQILKDQANLNFTSKITVVTISGNIGSNNDDIVLIRISPGNFTGNNNYLPSEFATISFASGETSKSFSIPLIVKATQSLPILLGDYKIHLEDRGGFVTEGPLSLYTDIVPLSNPTNITLS